MKDTGCTEFLQWSLPRLRLRWEGFRKVRKQICRRINRRIEELGISGFSAYRDYLARNPNEWQVMDVLCGVTISRFYRDRKVFEVLRDRVLPELAKNIMDEGGTELRCWSAGCSSGEEPYTLQIIWNVCVLPLLHREISLRIVATDINERLLELARQGCYRLSSLRDLPQDLREQAFTSSGDIYSIRSTFKEGIEFLSQDIRRRLPEGTFHLILCRNLVFTYFDGGLQRKILEGILGELTEGGVLVVGGHESLAGRAAGLKRLGDSRGIYRKEKTGEDMIR
ncbi:MAG TPA: CheR family methyltransferase [Thermodesulfovibrionales bacterium]|jgi:chemotaxis protein methyltransferase CheR|nr:CheR family methyltransferase [Thermodesulfovibrionales bacterium]